MFKAQIGDLCWVVIVNESFMEPPQIEFSGHVIFMSHHPTAHDVIGLIFHTGLRWIRKSRITQLDVISKIDNAA